MANNNETTQPTVTTRERTKKVIIILERCAERYKNSPQDNISVALCGFCTAMAALLKAELDNSNLEHFPFLGTDESVNKALEELDAIDPLYLAHHHTGASLILAERRRQIEEEGYDAAHDFCHTPQTLCRAAAAYALHEDCADLVADGARNLWPWGARFWKPKDHLRNLVRAGALIAAAIDRLLADKQL